MEGIIKAWGRILAGYQPNLSIEITRECPLTCPGCYAYGGDHLGGDVTLRQLQDFKGQQLVDAMFALLARLGVEPASLAEIVEAACGPAPTSATPPALGACSSIG